MNSVETYDQKLDVYCARVWAKFWDSRHVQLAIGTVLHEESESAVRIDQFLHPEEKPTYESLNFLSSKFLSYVSTVVFHSFSLENLDPLKGSLTSSCS